jgi:DNA-directed RNA polymerase sigma subunit (sigma70/sigma32)
MNRKGKKDHCHIDLGLAIMQTEEWQNIRRRWEWFPNYDRRRFGLRPTLEEIARLCGCQRERIRQIEERGLRKLRMRLRFYHDPVLKDAVEGLFRK